MSVGAGWCRFSLYRRIGFWSQLRVVIYTWIMENVAPRGTRLRNLAPSLGFAGVGFENAASRKFGDRKWLCAGLSPFAFGRLSTPLL